MAKTDVGVRIRGLKELQRACAKAEKDTRKNVRLALRSVAEPVQSDAQNLAQQFSHVGKKWWRMRIGVSRSVVYVAPSQRGRGTRNNAALARPTFGTKLMEEAMAPALEGHRPFLEYAVGKALDEMARDFHSPP